MEFIKCDDALCVDVDASAAFLHRRMYLFYAVPYFYFDWIVMIKIGGRGEMNSEFWIQKNKRCIETVWIPCCSCSVVRLIFRTTKASFHFEIEKISKERTIWNKMRVPYRSHRLKIECNRHSQVWFFMKTTATPFQSMTINNELEIQWHKIAESTTSSSSSPSSAAYTWFLRLDWSRSSFWFSFTRAQSNRKIPFDECSPSRPPEK